ncbi:MAG: ATP-binding protein [Thermodesulfobacteriota bacterium]
MQDPLAADLLAALDILIAERVGECSFRPTEPVPGFFRKVFTLAPAESGALLQYERSPFLAQFVEEAEEFWGNSPAGYLKSDAWSEEIDEREWFFVARALTLNQRKFLAVELLNGGFAEGRQRLQAAREIALSHRHARRIAEARQRAKEDFLAHMSHELRTPINGIVGNLELLQNTDLTEEQFAYLQAMELSTNSLLALIDNVLDFAKIDARKIELEAVRFSLRDCISETMTMMSSRALAKGLQLNCHVDSDVPDAAEGDPNRLQQVMMNLVSNGIKFTEHGEVSVRVERESVSEDGTTLHVSVTDTGIGIAPDQQDRIFAPFEQADSSVTKLYGGTGLGLAISSRLVETMGGRMWLESCVGEGSTFHFLIRLGGSEARSPDPTAATTEKPRGLNLYRIERSSRSLHILLVEDNPVNQLMATQMLQRMGHEVSVAGNGREAVSACVREAFDLVFMDVGMPEMDGVAATMAIREYERNVGGHVPIVAMTAYAVKGDREKFLAAGMDDYVSKPVRSKLLSETIEKHVMRSSETTPQQAPKSIPAEVLDRQRLREHLHGDEALLREVVLMCVEEYPHALEAVRAALKIEDPSAVEKAAHRLKGMLTEIHAGAAKRAALGLEKMGETRDLTEVEQGLAALEHEMERLGRALRAIASEGVQSGESGNEPERD